MQNMFGSNKGSIDNEYKMHSFYFSRDELGVSSLRKKSSIRMVPGMKVGDEMSLFLSLFLKNQVEFMNHRTFSKDKKVNN